MRTDSTIWLTHIQYRALAETAKASGIGLKVDTFEQMGCWGDFCMMASDLIEDSKQSRSPFIQRSCATLATSIDLSAFRRAQRPEIDWSVLEDHEVYAFVLQHELGHRIDNYCVFEAYAQRSETLQPSILKTMQMANEVLADRFAWGQIRPGEALPLCEEGRRRQQELADAFELLDTHVPRTRRQPKALLPGQYLHVPAKMLRDDRLLAFIGTEVNSCLIERTRMPAHQRFANRLGAAA